MAPETINNFASNTIAVLEFHSISAQKVIAKAAEKARKIQFKFFCFRLIDFSVEDLKFCRFCSKSIDYLSKLFEFKLTDTSQLYKNTLKIEP
jgi:hypothetical protein